jgi:hypothetical protein
MRLDPAGNWPHQYTTTKRSGTTLLRYLPAGGYEISTSIDGKKRRLTIQVPGQATVRLE